MNNMIRCFFKKNCHFGIESIDLGLNIEIATKILMRF